VFRGLIIPLVLVSYVPLIIKTIGFGTTVSGFADYVTTTYYNYQLKMAYRDLLIQSNCISALDRRDICVFARKKILEVSHDQTLASIDLCIEGATTR